MRGDAFFILLPASIWHHHWVFSMLRTEKPISSTECLCKTVSSRKSEYNFTISFKLLLFKLFIFNTMKSFPFVSGKFPLIKFFVLSILLWSLDLSLKPKIRKYQSPVVVYFPFLWFHCYHLRSAAQRKIMELNCVALSFPSKKSLKCDNMFCSRSRYRSLV